MNTGVLSSLTLFFLIQYRPQPMKVLPTFKVDLPTSFMKPNLESSHRCPGLRLLDRVRWTVLAIMTPNLQHDTQYVPRLCLQRPSVTSPCPSEPTAE